MALSCFYYLPSTFILPHRTPQLEGRPGRQAKLMEEILAFSDPTQRSDKAAARAKKNQERVNGPKRTLCSA